MSLKMPVVARVVLTAGLLTILGGADQPDPVDPAVMKAASAALQRMVAAQKSGDLDAYASTLASPLGPVFLRFADAATKLGQTKRQLLAALDAKFGPAGPNDDRFDDAVDESQQRALLQELQGIQIDASAPTGDQVKMNVTTTIRLPSGQTRQIHQGFLAIQQQGVWKVEDMAIVNHLANQKKLAEADWEINRGFTRIMQDVAAGKYPSRAAATAAARLMIGHATGADVPPPPGDAIFQQAVARAKGGDSAPAFPLFLQAAKLGHAKAECEVGILYSDGIGVAQDNQQAISWFRKSADQGNPVAQNDLGSMLLEPKTPFEDTKEGWRLLTLSAKQDYGPACTNIARAYLFGMGVPKNFTAAMQWYDRAANLGDDQAAYFFKWLKTVGNRSFRDEKQRDAYHQIESLRAAAFGVESGGTDYFTGATHAPNPALAAQMRAQADALARENGLD